jgi:hypothetical protein
MLYARTDFELLFAAPVSATSVHGRLRKERKRRGRSFDCDVELLAASACEAQHGLASAFSVQARCAARARTYAQLDGRVRDYGGRGSSCSCRLSPYSCHVDRVIGLQRSRVSRINRTKLIESEV